MMNPEKDKAWQKIAEAQAKLHKLLTGAESVSIRDGNSIIEFTRNDIDRLCAYVNYLEVELCLEFENTQHPLVAILHRWIEMFRGFFTQYFSSPWRTKRCK